MQLAHGIALAATALCLAAFTYGGAGRPERVDVDAVIGKGGFNVVCPVVPGNGIDHDTQITRRLIMLETLLRQRDVSDWPAELQAERARNLDRLHAYRLRGEYPRNYDHPDQLLPCFIDRDGAICAVGYLVQQSAGQGFAEKINSRYQYATIAQMHDPALDRWIERSGLTRAEIETIQVPESFSGGYVFAISQGASGSSIAAADSTASGYNPGGPVQMSGIEEMVRAGITPEPDPEPEHQRVNPQPMTQQPAPAPRPSHPARLER